eukprot:328607-Pyramimonas_sp.AAC.2
MSQPIRRNVSSVTPSGPRTWSHLGLPWCWLKAVQALQRRLKDVRPSQIHPAYRSTTGSIENGCAAAQLPKGLVRYA